MISVGNIVVGGTGKTPFTILLVARLKARGMTPVVLSRGYGRLDSSAAALVVDADTRVQASGDEPLLIARRTGVPVVVCANRVRGAGVAIDALSADVLVMDDGFQHWRLERDLDIVMLDAAEPFGNGHLMPAGRLRERPDALGRAGLLVVNHGVAVGECSASIPDQPRVDVFVRAHAGDLAGVKVGLLAGIARPERFEATIVAAGGEVVHTAFFADHHWITASELAAAERAAAAAGATRLLTTEKDAVRLPAGAVDAVRIDMVIAAGDKALDAALQDPLDAALDAALDDALDAAPQGTLP